MSRWDQKIRKQSRTHAKALIMTNNALVMLWSLSWALGVRGPQAVPHLAHLLSQLCNSTMLLCAPFLTCISTLTTAMKHLFCVRIYLPTLLQ